MEISRATSGRQEDSEENYNILVQPKKENKT
jgi:hypothetical protein